MGKKKRGVIACIVNIKRKKHPHFFIAEDSVDV